MELVETHGEDRREGEEEHQPVVLARVTCEFPGGEDRVLFLTELSLGGASITALRMPALGTTLMLRIFPRAMQPLRGIEARVISQRLDPRDPERCGFGVVFVELDDLQFEELAAAMASLARQRRRAPRLRDHLRSERRADPRIRTNLAGVVSIGEQALSARVLNLSLNGGFVGLRDAPLPPELTRGTEIVLEVLHQGAPDNLTIQGTVVRRSGAAEPPGIGVRFRGLGGTELSRLEGILLASLIEGEGFLTE
jgi:PilZ domain